MPLVTARIGQQQKIYTTLVESKEPVDLATLSAQTGLEVAILESVMDYLCAQDMVLEAQPGRYTATKLSQLLTVPLFQDAVTHL